MPQIKNWKKDKRSDRMWNHREAKVNVKIQEQSHGYTVLLKPKADMMLQPQILTNESTLTEAKKFARTWMRDHKNPLDEM